MKILFLSLAAACLLGGCVLHMRDEVFCSDDDFPDRGSMSVGIYSGLIARVVPPADAKEGDILVTTFENMPETCTVEPRGDGTYRDGIFEVTLKKWVPYVKLELLNCEESILTCDAIQK